MLLFLLCVVLSRCVMRMALSVFCVLCELLSVVLCFLCYHASFCVCALLRVVGICLCVVRRLLGVVVLLLFVLSNVCYVF